MGDQARDQAAMDHSKLESTIEEIIKGHVGPDEYDNDAADVAAQHIIEDINKSVAATYGSGYKCATLVEVLHPDSAFAKRTQKLCVPADDFAQGVSWKNDNGVMGYAYVVVFKRA